MINIIGEIKDEHDLASLFDDLKRVILKYEAFILQDELDKAYQDGFKDGKDGADNAYDNGYDEGYVDAKNKYETKDSKINDD